MGNCLEKQDRKVLKEKLNKKEAYYIGRYNTYEKVRLHSTGSFSRLRVTPNYTGKQSDKRQ
jgi:hypothetical protein